MLKLLAATAGWREPSKGPELQGSSQGQEEEETQIRFVAPLGLLTCSCPLLQGSAGLPSVTKQDPGTQEVCLEVSKPAFPTAWGAASALSAGCGTWVSQLVLASPAQDNPASLAKGTPLSP